MPNCKEHEDCDLVCSTCGDYYCPPTAHDSYHVPFYERWRHVPGYQRRYEAMRQAQEAEAMGSAYYDDMPDDLEAYLNERAERMP